MADKATTMAHVPTPCEKYLRDLKQPCGGCHDVVDCIHCKDCNPKTFIVRLKDFRIHESCVPFGTGVEKVLSFDLDGDYSLRRTDDGDDFFLDETPESDEHAKNRQDQKIPACRWAASIPVDSVYVRDAKIPNEDGVYYYGDTCECMEGEEVKPVRAYIEIVVGGHSYLNPCGHGRRYGGQSYLRIAYDYLNDMIDEDGEPLGGQKYLTVTLFEGVVSIGPKCFHGGSFVRQRRELEYVNDDKLGIPGDDGEVTYPGEAALFGANRFCGGSIYWKACNHDYFFDSPTKHGFDGGEDLGSWSSDEGQQLVAEKAEGKPGCRACKRIDVPMRVATDVFGNRTALFNSRPHLGVPMAEGEHPLKDLGSWQGIDGRRMLFFNLLDETRVAEAMRRLEYAPAKGHHGEYLESVADADVTITNYGNTLEQPGYTNGKLVTLDKAMVDRGLLDAATVYKTLPLAVADMPAGLGKATNKVLRHEGDWGEHAFVRQLILRTNKAFEPPGGLFIHLKFRFEHTTEEQRGYRHRVGPQEVMIDNIPCQTQARLPDDSFQYTVEVNRFMPDFIEVGMDGYDGKGGTLTATLLSAQAVTMTAADYLKVVVPASDFSAAFDASGRCVVFYADNTIRLNEDAWSSSSSGHPDDLSSKSSQSESSESAQCGVRGQCRRSRKDPFTSSSSSGDGGPPPDGCFTGDTLVTLADGTSKPISRITLQDRVLAFTADDEIVETGVESILSRPAQDLVVIELGDTRIRTTSEHPFYLGQARYRTAELIEVGDSVYAYADGGMRKIKVTHVEDVTEPTTVYNLHTKGPHTFFANGVAVHNKVVEGCFTGETLVQLTEKRQWPISGLSRQHDIVAFDPKTHEYTRTRVLEIMEHVRRGFYKIVTDRGETQVTPEHPIYVGDGLFVKAKKLRAGATIYLHGEGGMEAAKVLSAKFSGMATTFFNLKVEAPNTYFANGMAVHNKGGGAGGGAGGCFLAGTMVATPKGDLPIESLAVGHRVYAFTADNEIVEGEVVSLSLRETGRVIEIGVGGRKIFTTPDHPFYTPSRRYVAAELLELGDQVFVLGKGGLKRQAIDSIEVSERTASVYNLHINHPNSFFANGVAVHNKGNGGGNPLPPPGGDDKSSASSEGDDVDRSQSSLSSESLSSLGFSESSDSSSTSCSSFSSESSSSIGCPKDEDDFNLNCKDADTRRQESVTLDLRDIVPLQRFCVRCRGCPKVPGDGRIYYDMSTLGEVCVVHDAVRPNTYTARVGIPGVAVGCLSLGACDHPVTVQLPLSVNLVEEQGRWTLEITVKTENGDEELVFYGIHLDSAKDPYQHCFPPTEGFISCNKPDWRQAECLPLAINEYTEISALVTNDLGMTWEDHKAIVRTAGLEKLSSPVAVADHASNKIKLFYVRSYQDEKGSTHRGTFYRDVDTRLFRNEDAFVKYDRPIAFTDAEPDDYRLGDFTDEGQSLRIAHSVLIGGTMEASEEKIAESRSQKGLAPRMLRKAASGDANALNIDTTRTTVMGYVERSGKMRLWTATAYDGAEEGHDNVDTEPSAEGGECPMRELNLVVSGISDKRCRCNIFEGSTKLIGEEPESPSQGQSPSKGYALWKSTDHKRWELFKGGKGLWVLRSRNKRLLLFKHTTNETCPPNGSYRMNCGTCNGWVVGTISGSRVDPQEEEESQSSERKGFEEDGEVVIHTSHDGGLTWNAQANGAGKPIRWRSGEFAYVAYDYRDDTTYLFYTTREELLFMKVLPSGTMDREDVQEYLDSDEGRVPIFVAGDTQGLDFRARAINLYPEEFVMNWRMGVVNRPPTASPLPQGGVRFMYVDVHGVINSGIWNGSMPQLVAKMHRRDKEEPQA